MVKVLLEDWYSYVQELEGRLKKHWELVTKRTNVVKAYKSLARELDLKQNVELKSGRPGPNIFSKFVIRQDFSLYPHAESGLSPRSNTSVVSMWTTYHEIYYSRDKAPGRDELDSWFQSFLQILGEDDLSRIEEAFGEIIGGRERSLKVWVFVHPESVEEYQVVEGWLDVFESVSNMRTHRLPSLEEREQALSEARKVLAKAESILKSPQGYISQFHNWANVYFFLKYWFFLSDSRSRLFPISESGTFLGRHFFRWVDRSFYAVRRHTIGQVEFFPSSFLSNPMVFHLEIDHFSRSKLEVRSSPYVVWNLSGKEVGVFFPYTTRCFWEFEFQK